VPFLPLVQCEMVFTSGELCTVYCKKSKQTSVIHYSKNTLDHSIEIFEMNFCKIPCNLKVSGKYIHKAVVIHEFQLHINFWLYIYIYTVALSIAAGVFSV